jgi:hypothetical protein
MKTNASLFWILGGFFFLADIAYIIWSIIYHGQGLASTPAGGDAGPIEWVGTIAIALTGVLSFFIAFYLGKAHGALGGELPEDRLDANIEDGDAEQGFFSPWSWWPVMLAASAALVFLGVAVGVWIALIGGVVVVVSLIGWQYEYYRGYFAH